MVRREFVSGCWHAFPQCCRHWALTSTSAAHDLVIAMSIVSSALLFVVLNYFAMVRSAGALTLANSGYFLGRCAGALLVGALIVLAYRKIRGMQNCAGPSRL